jgi:hypothetical protein
LVNFEVFDCFETLDLFDFDLDFELIEESLAAESIVYKVLKFLSTDLDLASDFLGVCF